MRIIVFILLSLSLSYSYIYEFKAKNAYGKDINFADFEDKVLVIFVANKEIKTDNELRKFNKLYNKYKEEDISFVGFAIKDLNVSSNNFCVMNYGVDFDMVGEANNQLSKLRTYILNIYESERLELYAPILIYDRRILLFPNIYDLQDELMDIFGSN